MVRIQFIVSSCMFLIFYPLLSMPRTDSDKSRIIYLNQIVNYTYYILYPIDTVLDIYYKYYNYRPVPIFIKPR